MPVKSKQQTKRQKMNNRIRRENRMAEDKAIEKAYKEMRLQNLEKGYIIRTLQKMYPNDKGKPCCHTRIYQAINVRKTNKELRALLESNP